MREELLNGKLYYPGSAIFQAYPDQVNDIEAFWSAIWYNYLNGSDTNGIHWYKRLGGKLYNDMVRRLSHHKWIISKGQPQRRWASVEINEDKLFKFVTVDELNRIKKEHKYDKYLLECNSAKASTLVRQNGKTKRTGLVRTGFRDAGNTQFGYDMAMLERYRDAVEKNLTKSMDKIRIEYPEMQSAEHSYDIVSLGIFEYHNQNRMETFTTGDSISDSRGRAISQGLKKVMNPISSKDARAALVITYEE